jgi:4-amino-4-deoxy-L-arabinose transferase-like glycosyltransferase
VTNVLVAPNLSKDARLLRWAVAIVAAVTVVRTAAIFLTPLQLYPDEAQYWLWSQAQAWGYASKPPMIAWLIGASTAIGGDGEAWVRLPAPLLHGATALVLFEVGRRLYGGPVGLLACVLWLITPAVALSSAFIATDAPFMLGLALSLWAYVGLVQAPDARGRLICAALLGGAMGLALLSKQAAIYFIAGLALHALFDRWARRVWADWAWMATLAAFAVVISPNLVWQAQNHFATLTHTAEVNAGIGSSHALRPFGGIAFQAAQLGVFGPIPFAVLIGGAVAAAMRRLIAGPDRLLLCMALPPLVAMTVFAVFREVEANWAAAAYPAGVVLVSAWLSRRPRWMWATLALQGAIAVLLAAALIAPPLVDALGQSRSLKRLRGWDETAAFVAAQARAAGPLSAVVVEDRSLFNELGYYGRDLFAGPGAPPLRMRPPRGQALNQAELTAPLATAEGDRVLIVAMKGAQSPRLPGEFVQARPAGQVRVVLDRRNARELEAWVGSSYLGPAPTSRSP